MAETLIKKVLRYGQEQVSYEVLKISHTFSMDDSDVQTCLQHENMLVPVQNHWEGTYVRLFDNTIFGGGSGERVPTIGFLFLLYEVECKDIWKGISKGFRKPFIKVTFLSIQQEPIQYTAGTYS